MLTIAMQHLSGRLPPQGDIEAFLFPNAEVQQMLGLIDLDYDDFVTCDSDGSTL
jgi:hypothetical protein